MMSVSQAQAQAPPQPRTVRLKDAISLARAKYGYIKRPAGEYNARKARDQAKYWKKKYADPEFRAKKLAADRARLESESRLDEKIEVFNDLTDRYETITRRQYDPAIHFIRVKA